MAARRYNMDFDRPAHPHGVFAPPGSGASSSDAADGSAASVESIITQSKSLRSRVSALGRTMDSDPDLCSASAVQVDLESLKPRLGKLARSAVTDVKIRAQGEEHRLRDSQDALLSLARDAASGVVAACSTQPPSRRPSLDPAGALASLDGQLAVLRRHAFDESASETKSLFW
jgi:hypothetical protein